MKALLIDVGNSRIKWARFSDGKLSVQRAAEHRGWRRADFLRTVFSGRSPDRVLVVNVAGAALARELAAACRAAFGMRPSFIRSQRKAAGVVTRYREPWRLGVDRWVAAIGAHHLVPTRAVCVVDIGTASTIDLIDAQGVHHGGAIIPGPQLMVESLLKDTRGIRRRAAKGASRSSLFARDTHGALTQGSRHATAAVVDAAMRQARLALSVAPLLMLTGGGAAQVTRLIRTRHRLVPDLVLRGLAALL